PVPVLYGRDCTETNCSGATAGPGEIFFFPGTNQLAFTPDGGLLGFGPISLQSNPNGQIGAGLTWGFAGGANFAQQTSQVQSDAYHMPGNMLLGNQTSLNNTQRAAVLLFTGWGDAANPAVLERPGTS